MDRLDDGLVPLVPVSGDVGADGRSAGTVRPERERAADLDPRAARRVGIPGNIIAL